MFLLWGRDLLCPARRVEAVPALLAAVGPVAGKEGQYLLHLALVAGARNFQLAAFRTNQDVSRQSCLATQSPLVASQPKTNQVEECRDGILPSDLLSLLIGAAMIRDGHFARPPSGAGNLHGDLRFETKTV